MKQKLLQKVWGFMNSTEVILDKCSHYTEDHLLCILSPTEEEKGKRITQQKFYEIVNIEGLRKDHKKLIKSEFGRNKQLLQLYNKSKYEVKDIWSQKAILSEKLRKN